MIHRYDSDYPNQLHQLVVSVSKHITTTKDGRLRFQKKPMEVNLANISRSVREHVVHYMIRDHFSGAFYGEVCHAAALIPIRDFLVRAWSEKPHYYFCGVPDYISVPKTVDLAFPGVRGGVAEFGIETVEVTSGFQGGIRDIPTWERYLRQFSTMHDDLALLKQWSAEYACKLSAYLCGDPAEKGSKMWKWYQGVEQVRVPPGDVWKVRPESSGG